MKTEFTKSELADRFNYLHGKGGWRIIKTAKHRGRLEIHRHPNRWIRTMTNIRKRQPTKRYFLSRR